MKSYKLFTIVILFISTSCSVNRANDYEPTLIKLKETMQKNLDSGIGMLKTDRQFMLDTDSIVTLVYTDVLNQSDDKKLLEREQERWLRKRKKISDSLWHEVDKVFDETGINPELEREIAYGTIGELNYERAIELNGMINKKNN